MLLLWEECRHTADYSISRAEAVSRAEDYFAALAKPLALDADGAGDEDEQPTRDPHTLAVGFLLRLRRTGWLEKDIIMDFTGYEERTYSERFAREDGSRIDIAACARKDAPGIVAIYYYTSPEFARNYTLTIQGLLNGYSTQKDGTIIVADEGIVIASNDQSLLGQNTADNEVVQAMKKHTDSQHIYHLKNEGTGCYGIMLKQRDYYIYAYLPDTEVFQNLPLSVISVIFFLFPAVRYILALGIQNQSGTPETRAGKR